MTGMRTRRGGSLGEDPGLLPALVRSVLRARGENGWTVAQDGPWCRVDPAGRRLRPHGWKLHVSATPLAASLVLVRAAEVLVRARASFRFAGTLDLVGELVSARYDRGGGGRFITVYPDDDEHFRALAAELDAATDGLPGPGILCGRPYRAGSLVHYRYGAFTGASRLGNDGVIEPMMRTPEGGYVRDRRLARFTPPPWAAEPFPEPRVEPPPAPAAVFLDDRYVVRKALRYAYKGGVYLGTEEATGRRVVIKEARRHVGALLDGTDGADLLRHEAAMHAALAPLGVAPWALGLFEQGGNLFFAQEHIDGTTLREWVLRRPEPARAEILDIAMQVVAIVERVHQAGYVLRDLNPGHLMIGADGRLWLIDLETVARPGEPTRRALTAGYAGPEALDSDFVGPAPRQSSDLYSLGAVLFHLCSGADAVFAPERPEEHPAGDRLAELVTRALVARVETAPLTPLILGLTMRDADERWSVAAARQFLQGLPVGGIAPPGVEATADDDVVEKLLADGLAYLVNTMTPENPRHLWPAEDLHALNDPVNVQYGAAGVLGVLTRACAVRGEPRLSAAVGEAADWIAARLPADTPTLPGLYSGRSGTAWALLDAARLVDGEQADSALRLARDMPLRWPNPGVSHGASGAGLAQLHFWRVTGDADFLARAIEAAEGVRAAAMSSDVGVLWKVPADFESALAGATHLGYAHGVAGIGTFLLLAGQAADREDLRALAAESGETLVRTARLSGDGAWWPVSPAKNGAEEPYQPPHWCSGSSGIGTFLIRLWQATDDRRYLDLVERAAVEVYRRRWQLTLSACHGLAGNADFLLDLAAALGEPRYRQHAVDLVACAYARRTVRDGLTVLPDESMTAVSAGYGHGLAGMLGALLRLRHGGTRLWLPDNIEER
jgi:serine/threonine protein kinase